MTSLLLPIGWPILVHSLFPRGGEGGAELSIPTYSWVYQSARLSHLLGVQGRKGHRGLREYFLMETRDEEKGLPPHFSVRSSSSLEFS